jgi:hypothetical protein
MLQEDTLLKQIKRLVEAIARLRANKKEDEPPLFETVDELILQLAGLKPALLRELGPAQLVEMLSPGGEIRPMSAVPAAVLLLERAKRSAWEGQQEQARRSKEQAVALLMAVEELDVDLDELAPYLELIDPLLDELGVGEQS